MEKYQRDVVAAEGMYNGLLSSSMENHTLRG
jgi:hypothetical protein